MDIHFWVEVKESRLQETQLPGVCVSDKMAVRYPDECLAQKWSFFSYHIENGMEGSWFHGGVH